MRTVIRKIWRSASREEGVITIEFSFIFIIFVFFIFLMFEICRFMYISASVDLTLAEAARITSRSENIYDYSDLFDTHITEQSAFWAMFINPENFTLKVTHCSSVIEAMNGKCVTSDGSDYPLAVYSAGYRYRPLLFAFDNNASVKKLLTSLQGTLNRRLVYVQEYERGDQ